LIGSAKSKIMIDMGWWSVALINLLIIASNVFIHCKLNTATTF